ncbi:MAG: 50S ribosomal protein L11 methyltransferase [Ignavibacteriales bacterium]|nr:50S ribosomal protein L11 methyltransferase [Ignavibacteriales bacterium]
MYSIADYGSMIADGLRVEAYVQAMRKAIRDDSVVVDIGAGTGIFALLACRFGARKVYAIEPTDAIQVAREIAAENRLTEHVEFIQNLSTETKLPERAQVIVSDLRGILPLFQRHIPVIIDARKRFLAPSGVMIPQRDILWTAVVAEAEFYNHLVGGWNHDTHGLDMQAARHFVTNRWYKLRVAANQLLVEPKCWVTLDYTTIESPDVCAEVSWSIKRAGTAHGLVMWFDSTLAEGAFFSNAPGQPELIYGNAFFPLTAPVPLAMDDIISVVFQAKLVDDNYLWSWNTCVQRESDAGEVKADFKQSTFFGTPLTAGRLHKRSDSYVPVKLEDGQIDNLILGLMNGKTSLRDIASQVVARFPTRFTTWREAFARVAEISEKYSQ